MPAVCVPCRSLRRWRAYAALSVLKKEKIQRAALLCFGNLRLKAWRVGDAFGGCAFPLVACS